MPNSQAWPLHHSAVSSRLFTMSIGVALRTKVVTTLAAVRPSCGSFTTSLATVHFTRPASMSRRPARNLRPVRPVRSRRNLRASEARVVGKGATSDRSVSSGCPVFVWCTKWCTLYFFRSFQIGRAQVQSANVSFSQRLLNSVPCEASCIRMARQSWRPAMTQRPSSMAGAASHSGCVAAQAMPARARTITAQVEPTAQKPMRLERAVSCRISSRVNRSVILRRVAAGSSRGVALSGTTLA